MSTPNIVILPKRKVIKGSLVVMRCDVSAPNTKNLNYTWYFGSSLLHAAVGGDILILSKVGMENAGEYTCRVKGMQIEKTSSEVVLNVHCK